MSQNKSDNVSGLQDSPMDANGILIAIDASQAFEQVVHYVAQIIRETRTIHSISP